MALEIWGNRERTASYRKLSGFDDWIFDGPVYGARFGTSAGRKRDDALKR